MGEILGTFVKFFLAAVCLPFVLGTVMTFKEYVFTYPSQNGMFLVWGAGGFLIIFLFLYQFWGIHEFGQKMMMGFFQFAKPFQRLLSVLFAPYLIGVLGGYYAVKKVFHISGFDHYFFFFTGFTLLMHILLVAQDLQEEEKSLLKPTYYFEIMLVILFNVILAAAVLDQVSGHHQTAGFLRDINDHAKYYYKFMLGIFTR